MTRSNTLGGPRCASLAYPRRTKKMCRIRSCPFSILQILYQISIEFIESVPNKLNLALGLLSVNSCHTRINVNVWEQSHPSTSLTHVFSLMKTSLVHVPPSPLLLDQRSEKGGSLTLGTADGRIVIKDLKGTIHYITRKAKFIW